MGVGRRSGRVSLKGFVNSIIHAVGYLRTAHCTEKQGRLVDGFESFFGSGRSGSGGICTRQEITDSKLGNTHV